MTNIAIRVDNLSKCYHIYDHPQDRLKQSIVPKLRSLAGRNPGSYYREFWALKDVSFEVGRGETVGIIGRNGSGKSTLLQLICGTVEPTTGTVETHGRVAALLELGAGFNPEFTGRENVYMSATVLGLTQDEIRGRFDGIAAFADIGDFIEQPVKHYSSGMYARLAFAVAINVEPSILVVDEALAVGDEPFQRKCFARIEEIRRNGGTILFVSHASSAIVALCDRAILLHGGERLYTGRPKTAVSWYQKLMNAPEKNEQIAIEISRLELSKGAPNELPAPPDTGEVAEPRDHADLAGHAESLLSDSQDESSFDPNLVSKSRVVYEPNGAIILNPRIESLDNRIVNVLCNGQKYRVCYQVQFERDCENVRFRGMLKTTTGVELGGGTYPAMLHGGISVIAGQVANVSLEFTCNLNPGVYFINCGLSDVSQSLHRIIDALAFRVSETDCSFSFGVVDFNFKSAVDFDSEWSDKCSG
jgi:lipopolysaccharide transport system ATP-binding protein